MGDDPLFHDLDEVRLEVFRQGGDGDGVDVVRVVREAGSLQVRDSLNLRPGARYVVQVYGEAPEDLDGYLSTAGPPAVFRYSQSASLVEVLDVVSGTAPAEPIYRALSGDAAFPEPVAKTSPALPLSFALSVADTTATGRLRLRLARYREERDGPPDHVDFDVEIPIGVDSTSSSRTIL
jgi:hypothetical protein